MDTLLHLGPFNLYVGSAWRAHELARARKALAKGEDVEAVLEALSKGLTQKMLHGAYAELHAGDASARENTAQVVQKLFLRKERGAEPSDER